MSRLTELGLVDLKWSDDEDGNIFAEGLAEYEIDTNNELAIFHGDTCIKVHECEDIYHAASMVQSHESILRWHIKMGETWRGKKINERGWPITKQTKSVPAQSTTDPVETAPTIGPITFSTPVSASSADAGPGNAPSAEGGEIYETSSST